jgi:hypothetical protein
MNEKLMRNSGFGKQMDLIAEGKCPLCETTIDQTEFKDELSKREFKNSGICQKCQDKTFG